MRSSFPRFLGRGGGEVGRWSPRVFREAAIQFSHGDKKNKLPELKGQVIIVEICAVRRRTLTNVHAWYGTSTILVNQKQRTAYIDEERTLKTNVSGPPLLDGNTLDPVHHVSKQRGSKLRRPNSPNIC